MTDEQPDMSESPDALRARIEAERAEELEDDAQPLPESEWAEDLNGYTAICFRCGKTIYGWAKEGDMSRGWSHEVPEDTHDGIPTDGTVRHEPSYRPFQHDAPQGQPPNKPRQEIQVEGFCPTCHERVDKHAAGCPRQEFTDPAHFFKSKAFSFTSGTKDWTPPPGMFPDEEDLESHRYHHAQKFPIPELRASHTYAMRLDKVGQHNDGCPIYDLKIEDLGNIEEGDAALDPRSASAKAIISREIHRLWQSGDMTARRANNALDSIGYDRRYSETEEDLQEAAAIARATLNELRDKEGAYTNGYTEGHANARHEVQQELGYYQALLQILHQFTEQSREMTGAKVHDRQTTTSEEMMMGLMVKVAQGLAGKLEDMNQ
jgi:hypothetical protein